MQGFGSDSRISLKGIGNVAFSDSTAARFAILYKERDGFHQITPNGDQAGDARRAGDEEVLSMRGSILHEFSDAWSAMVAVDYTEDNSDPTPSSIIAESDDPSVVTDVDGDIFTVEPAPGVTCSSLVPLTFQALGCFTAHSNSTEIFGVSLNVNGELGLFDVASITAWRSMEDDLTTHITFPFFQNTDQEQFSQEITFTSNFEGPFNFVGGGYFYNENARLDSTFFSVFRADVETKSYALFGQAEYDITDALTLTGGIRYTNENRDFEGVNFSAASPGFSRIATLDSDNVNYTVKLDYALNDNALVYASYSTGFKSPGFSPDCFSTTACFLPVAEEQLDSFEAGLRSTFLDNKVVFNATYFYNDYQDLQLSATVPGLGFTRINADKAQIQGIEIETSVFPTEGLEIFGNLGWLDAEYDNLTETQAEGITNAGASCPGIVPAGDPGRATAVVDCALGLELKNAPEFKISAGFLATVPVWEGDLTIGADLAYEDVSFALIANPPGSLVDPGTTFNARIAYAPTDGPWQVAFWGKNLGDREYFRATTSANNVYAMPPRTWGVDLSVRF